jgi:tetratricopeptide (TPR) repeat protein
MNTIQQLAQRGKASYEKKDWAAALEDFQEVLRQNPRFADIHHLTGLCLSFLGHTDAALQEFTQAVTLNPRYVEAHINRAITLNELGRFDEAAEAFSHAADSENDNNAVFPAAVSAKLANAHLQVGDLYFEAGAPTQAAEQYRTALEMRPRFHDIRVKLSQALMQLGDLDAAARELQQVLNENPRVLAARLNLGLIYFRQGDVEGAAREWGEAHEQQPANPQVRAYMAMLENKSTEASA